MKWLLKGGRKDFAEYEGKGKGEYTDPDFPPNLTSIYWTKYIIDAKENQKDYLESLNRQTLWWERAAFTS
jgi:hypothetical protein